MRDGNTSAAKTGVRHNLQKCWAKQSFLIRHDEEPPINASSLAGLFEPRPCFDLGVCVCRNAGEQGRKQGELAVAFYRKLVAFLKIHCWSSPKSKQKSEARKLLDSAALVIGLYVKDFLETPEQVCYERDGQHALSRVYFHIGFINYQSWTLTLLPLYQVHPQPDLPPASLLLQTLCIFAEICTCLVSALGSCAGLQNPI